MSSGGSPYRCHDVTEHSIQSRIVAQKFTIKVLQPIRRADGTERFPVVYVTDSDDFFGGFSTFANFLQLYGEAPRFVLVGIGYEDSRVANLMRWRDFFTHGVRARFHGVIEQVAGSALAGGVSSLPAITQTTDAREFLQFIRDELIPYITGQYSVLPNENSLFGYSAGGAFGLYTLSTQPNIFKGYILGSPATSYDGQDFGIELVRSLTNSFQSIDARVFISVGELEEFGRGLNRFELTTSYYQLAKVLKLAAIPGLALTTQVFPHETHATAWAPAFAHGLKSLFGPAPQVPFWSE